MKFNVTLARHFGKDNYKIKSKEVMWQRKFDGIRCYVDLTQDEVKLMSRNHKEITSLPHIVEELQRLRARGCLNNVKVLDGELIGHEEISFQEVCKIVRKKNPSEGSKKIRYFVYDGLTKDEKMSYLERFNLLTTIFYYNGCDVTSFNGYAVEYGMLDNTEIDIEAVLKMAVDKKWEGIMIRDYRAPYDMKRSDSLYKVKPTRFVDGKIIGVVSGKGKDKYRAVCHVELPNGKSVKARPAATDEGRHAMYIKRLEYIHKPCTLKYQELTDGGVPRFPVLIKVDGGLL